MQQNCKSMNPNTEYERFTHDIYRQLCQATMVNSYDVRHNEKLVGQSGQKHQIDVYWEYEKDGTIHRVAIECKNYSRRISLEKVCAFKGVIDDLNGVSGIMVSKVGFQKGAKKYAQQFGISLKELRTPRDRETIIGEIENHIHYEVRYTLFWINEEWSAENNFNIEQYRKRLSFLYPSRTEIWDSLPYIHIDRRNDILRDASGKEVTTIKRLEEQIPEHHTDDFPYIFTFDDAYLESLYMGNVKVRAVMFNYRVQDQQQIIALDAGYLVKAILKDAQSDETDFVALY